MTEESLPVLQIWHSGKSIPAPDYSGFLPEFAKYAEKMTFSKGLV
jgi:hypothetical protein